MAHSHGKPGGCSRSSRPSRVYHELHDSSNRGGKEIIRWQATEVHLVFLQQYYIYLYIYLSIYLYLCIHIYTYTYIYNTYIIHIYIYIYIYRPVFVKLNNKFYLNVYHLTVYLRL